VEDVKIDPAPFVRGARLRDAGQAEGAIVGRHHQARRTSVEVLEVAGWSAEGGGSLNVKASKGS